MAEDQTNPIVASVVEGMTHLTQSFTNLIGRIRNLQTYVDGHTVIIGTAMIEESLARALQSKMRPISRTLRDRIFDGYGPLSNIAAKIDVAYALDLLPQDMYDDLKTINKMRVRFAHSTKIRNFDDPEIAELTEKLSGMDASNPNMNLRFLGRLKVIDVHLEGFSKNANSEDDPQSAP